MSNIPSNITQMMQEIQASGLAFTNRYETIIYTPPCMKVSQFSQIRSLSIRCDAVTIPGRSFSTTPFRFYGPARNMPYEQIYSGELNLSFVLSEDLRERTFFEEWMTGVSSVNNYKMEYYVNYTTNMEITVIGKDDVPVYRFIIEEVYPKSLGDIQVGYDKDNEVMRQEVTVCFRKYSREPITRRTPPINPTTNQALPWSTQNFYKKPGGGIERYSRDGTVNGFQP
jgi:hypothetical protein